MLGPVGQIRTFWAGFGPPNFLGLKSGSFGGFFGKWSIFAIFDLIDPQVPLKIPPNHPNTPQCVQLVAKSGFSTGLKILWGIFQDISKVLFFLFFEIRSGYIFRASCGKIRPFLHNLKAFLHDLFVTGDMRPKTPRGHAVAPLHFRRCE